MQTALIEAIDTLINFDFAGRGVAHLYAAARHVVGQPLAFAAAQRLVAIPRGATVVITTGSASRAWIAEHIVESDGPAGAAAIARALALAFEAIPVIVVEAVLHAPVGGIMRANGLALVSLEEARRTALPGGRLSVAVLRDFPADDRAAQTAAEPLLDELQPALLFATERPGRNDRGIYHNARGVDYGQGKARLDELFTGAQRRGIPTIGVGDGGNELGMGLIADAVRQHVRFGDHCLCGCGGGVGAATATDVLVTAAVSNWGCYAIVACLAILLKNPELLHLPEDEARLLQRGVELGLINSPQGRVDPHVDAIPLSTHLAVTELLRELALRAIREQ